MSKTIKDIDNKFSQKDSVKVTINPSPLETYSTATDIVKYMLNGNVIGTSENQTIIKRRKNMNCQNNCVIKAKSIVSAGGISTITVPANSITGLCDCETICIGLFTSIPTSSECNIISITDGTTTKSVYCRNQFWRPCKLECRNILVLSNKEDPSLFVLCAVKK